ncbi:hypothetical protein [Sphingobacterium sp. SGR-19]|nr:hypothetical protein [Sphingobacterium sp. SGR-19]
MEKTVGEVGDTLLDISTIFGHLLPFRPFSAILDIEIWMVL